MENPITVSMYLFIIFLIFVCAGVYFLILALKVLRRANKAMHYKLMEYETKTPAKTKPHNSK